VAVDAEEVPAAHAVQLAAPAGAQVPRRHAAQADSARGGAVAAGRARLVQLAGLLPPPLGRKACHGRSAVQPEAPVARLLYVPAPQPVQPEAPVATAL
jgi:hypothetical protein